MTQNLYRTQPTGDRCPRCGAPIVEHQVGIMSAQDDNPVGWAAQSRSCSAGCQLTADDFPNG